VPVFYYRHRIQDKGVFPAAIEEDVPATSGAGGVASLPRRAGVRPYLVLAGGVVAVIVGQFLAVGGS
jgi:hypothetical protein